MRFKFPILVLLLFSFKNVFTQGQDQKLAFRSINEIGLLAGSREEAFMAQTINGLKINKWFTGVGVGLDFYKDRTIPLFLDVRRMLLDKKNAPFVYGDIGTNFIWLNDTEKEQRLNYASYTNPPGLCYDMGIGWKLSGKNGRGLIFSAGYSVKQVKENVKINWGAPTTGLQEQNIERYNYLYRRLVLKIGFDL